MIKYDCYYVEGCEKKDTWHLFQRVLLAYSDAFSLVYFKYQDNETQSVGVSQINEELSQYEMDERIVTEWPGTRHINGRYNYRMVTYRIDSSVFNVMDTLEKVDTLWDWDYPEYPMDICFYRNGIAWFATSAHEHWNALYLLTDGSFPLASDIDSIGIHLVFQHKVVEADIFHLCQGGRLS